MNLPVVHTETRKKPFRYLLIKPYNFLAMNELLPDERFKRQVAQRDVN